MSANKIDHVEEARQFDYQAQMTHAGPDVAALLAARAQAHATLALVEQQRIANLIAYGAEQVRQLSAAGIEFDDSESEIASALARLNRVLDQIREGLGIA